jgi:O-antigen/teichoic acid export membrane protein
MNELMSTTTAEARAICAVPEVPPVFGSFARGVALTSATRLLMLASVLGASIIVGRWLGPEGLGALAVLNVTVALALQIGSAGLPSANTYFIAQDRKRLGPVWANALMFGFAAGSVLALAVLALARIDPLLLGRVPFRLIALAALAIPFQLLTLLGLNVFLAVDRIDLLNLLDLATPALLLVNAIVVLLILGSGLSALVSFNTSAVILLAVVMLVVVGRVLARQKDRDAFRPDFLLLKRTLTYGAKFYVSIVAGVAIFRADLLIVNHFRGVGEAGVYAVASQVANLLMILPGVIAILLFPRVAADPDPRGKFALRVTRHASFLMLVICVVSVAGSFVLPLVYGPRFADATLQLLILLPGVYLVSIESVLVQHFTGTGLPVAIPIFWLITLVLNLTLNLALVPTFGARAAAVISTVSYTLIFVLVAVYFCMKTERSFSEIFILRQRELRDLLARVRSFVPATKVQQ